MQEKKQEKVENLGNHPKKELFFCREKPDLSETNQALKALFESAVLSGLGFV